MASIVKRGKKYLVRWYDPDGAQRTRTVPTAAAAKALALDVETARGLGRRWEPADARALPALIEVERNAEGKAVATGGAFFDFLRVARGQHATGTVRHYDRALRLFLVHLRHTTGKRRLTVDLLTKDALETWLGSLLEVVGEDEPRTVGKGISGSTARLYVGAVLAAWRWAYDSDTYGKDVARPKEIKLPTPTYTPAAAPTWAQMDAVIGHAEVQAGNPDLFERERRLWGWHIRLLTLLRFTGLRVDSQVMELRWEDFDLDAGLLTLRGELGKSKRERTGREIPLSPHLVETMAGWGVREGFVVAPWKKAREVPSRFTTSAWEAAGVPERVWGNAGVRGRGSPFHAFRRGFKTGLADLGVESDVRDFLVGHHRGIDERYVELVRKATAAVGRIPALASGNVLEIRRPNGAG